MIATIDDIDTIEKCITIEIRFSMCRFIYIYFQIFIIPGLINLSKKSLIYRINSFSECINKNLFP